MKLYQDVIGAAKVKLDVQRARDARKADGSVLEYGLDYHLEKLSNDLKRGPPSSSVRFEEYVQSTTAQYQALIQWLEDFRVFIIMCLLFNIVILG